MFFTTFFFRVISQSTYEQLVPNRSQTFVFIPNTEKCETGTAWKVPKYGVFSGLNTGKYGPEKTPYLETFVEVRNTFIWNIFVQPLVCRTWVWCVISNVFLLIAPSSKSVCAFLPGDGIGGSEELIGVKSSPDKCIEACIAQRAVYPDINGVTIPKKGTVSCYCERKMKSRNSSTTYKSCILNI